MKRSYEETIALALSGQKVLVVFPTMRQADEVFRKLADKYASVVECRFPSRTLCDPKTGGFAQFTTTESCRDVACGRIWSDIFYDEAASISPEMWAQLESRRRLR